MITGGGKWKLVIRIVLWYTLVYITNILPIFIQNVAIIKTGIFHEELPVLIWGKLFLFTFNSMFFNVKRTAKFCHSVCPVFWCLFIGLPKNLPDMTCGPTVYRKVDRSIKQVKFHLKSYHIPGRRRGINNNKLPKSQVRNLCFETLSLWIDQMMDE